MANRAPALHELGDLQLKILSVVWELGEASVNDLLAKWDEEPLPAYVTLLTVCRRLEKRGLLEHREQARPGTKSCFIYRPLVSREALQKAAVEGLMERLALTPAMLTIYAAKLATKSVPSSGNVRCRVAGCHTCFDRG
jgi:BlaI family penicillinase repressor